MPSPINRRTERAGEDMWQAQHSRRENQASHRSLSLRFIQRDTVQRGTASREHAVTHALGMRTDNRGAASREHAATPALGMRGDNRGTASREHAVTPALGMRGDNRDIIQEKAEGYAHGRPTSEPFTGPAYSINNRFRRLPPWYHEGPRRKGFPPSILWKAAFHLLSFGKLLNNRCRRLPPWYHEGPRRS